MSMTLLLPDHRWSLQTHGNASSNWLDTSCFALMSQLGMRWNFGCQKWQEVALVLGQKRGTPENLVWGENSRLNRSAVTCRMIQFSPVLLYSAFYNRHKAASQSPSSRSPSEQAEGDRDKDVGGISLRRNQDSKKNLRSMPEREASLWRLAIRS